MGEIIEIIALERQRAKLEALQYKAIAMLAEQRDDVAEELALVLAVTVHKAQRMVDLATTLVHRLPLTFAAMRRGDVDSVRAGAIAGPTAWLSDEHARQVDVLMADRLEGRNPGQLRRAAARAVHRVDPDGAAARAQARRQERKVELLPGFDGMSTLVAELPAEVASAAYARVDRLARQLRGDGEGRTLDQLRADVFADLVLGSSGGGGAKAEIFVYVDAKTLAGADEQPAELAGYGPIPAWLARQIAHDSGSTWRRIVTDPLNGRPIDVGRQRYRPPAVTDRFVRVRDRECRFPGCNRPAQFGDNDHHRPWGRHGDTDTDQLVNYCRRHHRLKDRPGWRYELERDTGVLTITTPAGMRYASTPGAQEPVCLSPNRRRGPSARRRSFTVRAGA
ncbi:HNH endonuclease [Prauserella sp. PE36]|uniref:HNH endonuclease signature motif containing protein n=1 Tax=Prauserella sp. PE36 TaxID=1504709 RepID=UPI000DE1BB11|nr:HNH endonuclease signature motif containing protein [Prauserella sp. PE36]RBM16283.1 HNH endonuclease [Prauserella sp. PE36]